MKISYDIIKHRINWSSSELHIVTILWELKCELKFYVAAFE